MAKYSVNYKCPCGSNIKYKKCCALFHKGKLPSTALELMKSRYCAYVLKDVKYIINTTDVNNPDYTNDTISWASDIEEFCVNSDFKGLGILEFIPDNEISYVKFYVELYINNENHSFTEKSKFVKVNNKWLYQSATFQ